MKGKRTVLEVQQQLAQALQLAQGQEDRLRLMLTGTGEFNGVMERGEDTQRVSKQGSVPVFVEGVQAPLSRV